MKALLTFTLCLTLALCGCASWQSTSGKVLTSSALTVDATMKGWAKWSATHPVSEQTHASVRGAYEKYQAAMAVAVEAYADAVNSGERTAWGNAREALELALSALTTLTQSSQKP